MSSIYRNIKELKLRLLEKQLTTKLFFLFWGKKAILFKKKWQHHQNNVIALKSVYWNQCFSVWKMVGMVVRPAKVLFSPFCLKTKCTCDLPEFPFPRLLFEDLVYMWSTWSPLTSSSVWRPSVHVSYLKSPSPLSCLKTKCTCDLPEFPFPCPLFEDLVYMWPTWIPLASSPVWRPSVHVTYLNSPSLVSCLKTKCTYHLLKVPFPPLLFEDQVYMWPTWIPLASSPVWRPSVHVTYLKSLSLPSCLKTKCTCDLLKVPFPRLLFEDQVYMWPTWSPLPSSPIWRPSVHVTYLKSPSLLSCLKTKLMTGDMTNLLMMVDTMKKANTHRGPT